jgi:probable HAF family extracellular repeat protein
MKRFIRIFLVATIVVFKAVIAAPLFIPLGDLSGGDYYSMAKAVSDDGSVVTGFSYSQPGSSGYEAFRWTDSANMEGLGYVDSTQSRSRGTDISADGEVIVGWSGLPGAESFRWSESIGIQGIGDIPGGLFGSVSEGVSADGSVIVGYGYSTSSPEAYRWTESGGFNGLGDFDGGVYQSQATSVSRNGDTIVGWGTTDVARESFRWTGTGGLELLEGLPRGHSIANDVSDDGRIIVGQGGSATNGEAFLWEQDVGWVGLGDLAGGGHSSVASTITGNGLIVGGSSITDIGREAFVWDSLHGMLSLTDVLTEDFDLDLTGWILNHVFDISIDGRYLVGYGSNPDGNTEGWLVRLDQPVFMSVSEPSTFLLFIPSFLLILLRFNFTQSSKRKR